MRDRESRFIAPTFDGDRLLKPAWVCSSRWRAAATLPCGHQRKSSQLLSVLEQHLLEVTVSHQVLSNLYGPICIHRAPCCLFTAPTDLANLPQKSKQAARDLAPPATPHRPPLVHPSRPNPHQTNLESWTRRQTLMRHNSKLVPPTDEADHTHFLLASRQRHTLAAKLNHAASRNSHKNQPSRAKQPTAGRCPSAAPSGSSTGSRQPHAVAAPAGSHVDQGFRS